MRETQASYCGECESFARKFTHKGEIHDSREYGLCKLKMKVVKTTGSCEKFIQCVESRNVGAEHTPE